MVVNDRENDWDEELPHVEADSYNSVDAAIGVAPNQAYLGRLPRLPITVINAAVPVANKVWVAISSRVVTLHDSASGVATSGFVNIILSPHPASRMQIRI